MPAGRGNLERAFCTLLALDVAKVEQRRLGFVDLRLGARQYLRALEMIRDLDQRACRADLDIRARPGRLRPASRRTDHASVPRIGAYRRRQYPTDRRDQSVEPQFAEHGEARPSIQRTA